MHNLSLKVIISVQLFNYWESTGSSGCKTECQERVRSVGNWQLFDLTDFQINYGLGWNPSSILSFLLSFLLRAQNREWNLESILEVKKKQPRIYIIHNYVCFPSIPTLWPPQSRGFWNGYIDWNDDDEMTEWFHFALIASSVRLIYLKSQHCQYFSFELLLKHALPYPHFVVVFRNVCKVCLLLNYLGLHGLKVRIFITVE